MDKRTTMAVLEDEDESVRIAVKALGNMKNGTSGSRSEASRKPQALSIPQNNPPSPSQSPTSSQAEAGPSSPDFVARMTSIPLLKSALTVYEQGKASSRVVKYGAEMVESSVKTLSRPVIDRLPVNVNQLDEFACRQLDRLDRYRRPSANETSPQRSILDSPSETDRTRAAAIPRPLDGSNLEDFDVQSSYTNQESSSDKFRSRKEWMEGERGIPSWIESTHSFAGSSSQGERSATPTQGRDETRSRALIAADVQTNEPQNEQQVAQRSRWQAVLLEAGGLSAALSEESMRRLKYCLQWLQYATAHIDAQILIIREFTASLQEYPPDAPPHARRPNPISEEHMRKLAEVRKDIVQTVRQVVDVVSKYAGGALPEPARATVRGFILKLPQRWASRAAAAGVSANNGMPAGNSSAGSGSVTATAERDSVTAAASGVAGRRNGQRRGVNRERGAGSAGVDLVSPVRSAASSTVVSPAASPRMSRATLTLYTHPSAPPHVSGAVTSASPAPFSGQQQPQQPVSRGAAIVAAQRILSLATESLDMMRGVTGVVKDSLDRADLWVSRLRTVGLQRNQQDGAEADPRTPGDPQGPQNNKDKKDGVDVQDLPPSLQRRRRRDSGSQFSDDMPSPFFSGSTSSAWNSSIPSTPVGAYTPVYSLNAPSPTAIPMGLMTLSPRYNTPKSGKVELQDDDSEMQEGRAEEEGVHEVLGKYQGEDLIRMQSVGVKVAGVDRELEEGSAEANMEVDELQPEGL